MEGFTVFVLIVLRAGSTENGAEEQGYGKTARSVLETEAAAYGAILAKVLVQVGRLH